MEKDTAVNSMIQQYSLQAFLSDQYAIKEFRESMERKNTLVKQVTEIIEHAIDDADLKSQTDSDPKERWTVAFSEQQLKDIEANVVILDQNDKGEYYAQFRKNGKYGNKVPIKKEIIEQGLTQADVMLALQLKAVEKKLDSMMDTLSEIQEEVNQVRQGQQNDRIGLYMSAVNMYIESKTINDLMLRKQVIAQAIRGLSDSNSQLVKEILDDVEYLVNKQYKKAKRPKEVMDERIENINKCFDIVNRSFVMKAAVYYEADEIQAMLTVFDEYCRFMESAILPYAERLREMDRTDRMLIDGKWEQRVESLRSMREIQKYIRSNKEYYLAIEEEER